MRNIVLTGVPRGGTTLACRLLGSCANSVALFEPMDVRALPQHDPAGAAREVEAFFATARRQLVECGTAPSKVRDGRLPDNPFGAPEPGTGIRPLQTREGVLHAELPAGVPFTLTIKHNAAFTALLPHLPRDFQAIAVVRHPLAVLASWHSLDLPVSAGRLPAGERLDRLLQHRLQAEPDLLARQLLILDWCFGHYARLPPARVLRYEEIVATGGQALFRLAGLVPNAPPEALRDRNLAPSCPRHLLPQLAARLLDADGAWRSWYPRDAVTALLDRLLVP